MSIDSVRALVHRVITDIFHAKKLELVDELYTVDFVGHQIPAPLPPMLGFTTTGKRSPRDASTAIAGLLITRARG